MASRGKTAIRLPRKYEKDDVIEVKTRIIHPNDNGRRKYKDDGYIPEYYIWKIDVYYGDDPLLSMNASGALSQNPYFTFTMKATHSAPLRVEWVDTTGERYTEVTNVEV